MPMDICVIMKRCVAQAVELRAKVTKDCQSTWTPSKGTRIDGNMDLLGVVESGARPCLDAEARLGV